MDSSPGSGTPSGNRKFLSGLVAHADHGSLPAQLLAMTFVSGLVDAVSFLELGHVFVANMTGNIVFIAFSLAGGPGFSIAASTIALGGFIAGATAIGFVPQGWASDRIRLVRSAVCIKLVVAAPVIAAVAAVGVKGNQALIYAMILCLSFTMGIQNVLGRRLGVAEIASTTVFSIAIASLPGDIRAKGWRDPAFYNRVLGIGLLFSGALVGALLVLNVGTQWALGLGAAVLATVGFAAHLAIRRNAPWAAFRS